MGYLTGLLGRAQTGNKRAMTHRRNAEEPQQVVAELEMTAGLG
jgi:hypothetical protein